LASNDDEISRVARALFPDPKPPNWLDNWVPSSGSTASNPLTGYPFGLPVEPSPYSPPTNALGSIFGALAPIPSTPPANALASILAGIQTPAPAKPTPVAIPSVQRKVYFAFSFDDLMRVNNVRQIGKVGTRETKKLRTFYDRSIWESRSIKTADGLKNLMRNGVKQSSAVCVLIGSETWQSRWVKYEIARAVIDQRGLFGVHLNSLNHHQRRGPDGLGLTPLYMMGVYRDLNNRYYLYERCVDVDPQTAQPFWKWLPYEDYTDPVPLPRYINSLDPQHVISLSAVTSVYDMVADAGAKNVGVWIDDAAKAAGR
jgi:hypothetical protein